MLFRRRHAPRIAERLRVALWPRRSWGRSGRYVAKRVLRISATPYAVAIGVAAGTFASFTPFLGFHIIIACTITFFLRGNLVAAALGTAVGSPLTFPFIWAATYRVGEMMLGGDGAALAHADIAKSLLANSLDVLWPIVKPMMLGALPVGLPVAAVAYAVTWLVVRGYQQRRRARLSARALAAEKAVAAAERVLERS